MITHPFTVIHFLYISIFQLRFGMANKKISSTSVFEHSGKLYASSENHLPQEIDLFTLETLEEWDVNGAWRRPFTSHPKVLSSSTYKTALIPD